MNEDILGSTSTPEMFRSFPDGWHVMDLIGSVVAVLMFAGVTRVTYRAIAEIKGWHPTTQSGDED